MKRIGRVVRTAGGMAIARSPDDSHPEIGEQVIDESLSAVGAVVDVMGPTSKPLIVINPTADDPESLLNEPLYSR